MNIIICDDNYKETILKNNKYLNEIKIITLNEFKKKYIFDYTEDIYLYITKKYNCIYNVAKIYLDNLYYVYNKDINNDKVKFLKEIINDLKENNKIIENHSFKKFLSNKNITIINPNYMDKFYLNIFKELEKNNNIIYKNDTEITDSTKKDLYKCSNKEEEIVLIASEICKLVNNNIDINNIKLANVNNDYYYTIKKIFKQFNIPINLDNNSSIYGSLIVKDFINNYSSNIEETINNIPIKSDEDKKILDKIIDIINKYSWTKDYLEVKSFIIEDIKNIKYENKKLTNAVEVIDLTNTNINDKDYVFLINFNEGIIPSLKKDEDYLSDKIKKELNINTSYEINTIRIKTLQNKIKEIKNLIVTYSDHDLKDKLYISSAYQKDLFNEKEAEISYNYSNDYNKLKLVSLKDEYSKYGSISEELKILSKNYKLNNYLTYDNNYKGITSDVFKEKITNITLSYTSIDDYYKCSFRYYLDYILKLNKYEDTFDAIIGTIFHEILSIAFNDNFNFDKEYENTINKYNFNEKEKFFINNLKDELRLVIDTIKDQNTHSNLKHAFYEKEFTINLSDNIKFIGFVDKIMYEQVNNKTICTVIDYKTGNPNIALEYTPLGLNMQLPVYIYLIKHSDLKNIIIGGFYLQKILTNEKDISKKIDSLKLQGYSNSNIDVLKEIDDTYQNSEIIKSLKMTNNGFSAYSKILNDEQIENLSNIVEEKIMNATNDIIDTKFDINPKEVDGKNLGCMYCHYKDICYMKNENIIKIKLNKEEKENGMDE